MPKLMPFTLAMLLLVAASSPGQDAAVVRRVDGSGDPLPEGALRRLGTLRWRIAGQATALRYSPDGQFLAIADAGEVRLWDAKTGAEFDRFPGNDVAFSPDGRLAVGFGVNQRGLNVRDVRKKQFIHEKTFFPVHVQFAPDGKTLWFRDMNDGLILYDWAQAKIVRTIGLRELSRDVFMFHLSPNGKLLAVCNSDDNNMTLVNAETGRQTDVLAPPARVGRNASVPLFSPNGKILAALSANAIDFWDVAAKTHLSSVKSQLVSRQISLSASFNPAGNRLALCGNGPIVYDLDKRILEFKVENNPELYSTQIAYSPDGSTLAIVAADGKVSFWDPTTWRAKIEDPHPRGGVDNVVFSNDGKILAAVHGADSNLHLWDAAKGTILRDIIYTETPGLLNLAELAFFQFSRDDQVLILGQRGRWNVASRKPSTYRLLNDARILGAAEDASCWVVARHDEQTDEAKITLFDTYRNRDIATINLEKPAKGVLNEQALFPAVSSRGEWVALHKTVDEQDPNIPRENRFVENAILLWSAKAGKVVHTIPLPVSATRTSLAISPDGRFLATDNFGADIPALCHVATGLPLWRPVVEPRKDAKKAPPEKRLRDLDDIDELGDGLANLDREVMLAFSADGLQVAGFSSEKIIVRESLSGQILKSFTAQEKRFPCLAFTPDGKTLATGSRESTILVWNTDPFPAVKSEPWDRERADAWWKSMSDDVKDAYPAMARMITGGSDAVAFLREKLRVQSADEAKEFAKLIDDLASPTFAVREAASQKLDGRGFRFIPTLQKAAAQSESLEQRNRIQAILKARKTTGLSPDELRDCRALIVLERISNPGARTLLETLAQGLPDDIRAQSATAALERLKAR